jgi:hypothetical protein
MKNISSDLIAIGGINYFTWCRGVLESRKNANSPAVAIFREKSNSTKSYFIDLQHALWEQLYTDCGGKFL